MRIVLILLISLTISKSYSQSDSTNNTINYGFNKIINNMDFVASANVNENSSFGNIKWSMDYLGIATMPRIDFRDNLQSNFVYEVPSYGISTFKLRQSINYYGEEQFTGETLPFNQLMENQGQLGLGLKLDPFNQFNVYYGIEYHKQAGYDSQGNTFFTDLNIDQVFAGYKINLNADHLDSKRSFNRNYERSNLISSIFKNFDANNRLSFDLSLYSLQNDIIQASDQLITVPDVETRREQRADLNLTMNYSLTDKIKANSRLIYGGNLFRERHRIYDQESPRTGVTESRDETSYIIQNNFFMKFNSSNHTIQVQLDFLENDFEVINHDIENPIELENLEKSAFNRDKNNQNTLISYTGAYKITDEDHLQAAVSYGIYREDTPSDDENSDNDVLNINSSVIYSKFFSEVFEMNLLLSSRYQKFVYLKSEFSSGNFTQRSLKLNPYFAYRLNRFRWYPNFQIAVEYLSFDFTTRLGEIRGNAKRHMFYRDSLFIDLSNSYYLKFDSQFHFRETGNFNWNEFTQTITDEKTELFSKLMVFNRLNDKLQVGLGSRLYRLVDTREGLKIRSISPETDIILIVNNTKFELRGWYEFQLINDRTRNIPNIFLNTSYNF